MFNGYSEITGNTYTYIDGIDLRAIFFSTVFARTDFLFGITAAIPFPTQHSVSSLLFGHLISMVLHGFLRSLSHTQSSILSKFQHGVSASVEIKVCEIAVFEWI